MSVSDLAFFGVFMAPMALGLLLLVYAPLRGAMGSRWVAPMCALGGTLILTGLWALAELFDSASPALTAVLAAAIAITVGFYCATWRAGQRR